MAKPQTVMMTAADGLTLRDGYPAVALSLNLTLYLRLVILLSVGFVALSLCTMILARGATMPNPFSAFADVFPGQPESAVEALEMVCTQGPYDYLMNKYCTTNPQDGAFSQIGVVIHRGVVVSISFRLRGDTTRVGDLMLLWGIPDVQKYDGEAYLFWRRQGITAFVTEYNGHFTLYLPVRRVIITDAAEQSIRHPPFLEDVQEVQTDRGDWEKFGLWNAAAIRGLQSRKAGVAGLVSWKT